MRCINSSATGTPSNDEKIFPQYGVLPVNNKLFSSTLVKPFICAGGLLGQAMPALKSSVQKLKALQVTGQSPRRAAAAVTMPHAALADDTSAPAPQPRRLDQSFEGAAEGAAVIQQEPTAKRSWAVDGPHTLRQSVSASGSDSGAGAQRSLMVDGQGIGRPASSPAAPDQAAALHHAQQAKAGTSGRNRQPAESPTRALLQRHSRAAVQEPSLAQSPKARSPRKRSGGASAQWGDHGGARSPMRRPTLAALDVENLERVNEAGGSPARRALGDVTPSYAAQVSRRTLWRLSLAP